MGVNHGGTGGQVPSEFGVGGTLRQIVPLRFRHRNTKMSVLWPSKYAKIRFRPELCPRPHWESSRRSPKPPSQLGRGHPSPYPIPLGTDPSSALAMRPPQNSSQIYAYDFAHPQTDISDPCISVVQGQTLSLDLVTLRYSKVT